MLFLIFFILYPLIIYPLLLLLLKVFSNENYASKPYSPRKIAVVIPFYNEKKILKDKILNTLSLDFPYGKEIILSDDCSDDDYIDEIKEYLSSVKIIKSGIRKGKVAAINAAVSRTDADMIILTDATARLEKDAVLKLLSRFSFNTGAVCGRLKLKEISPSGLAEKIYTEYENFLKKTEGNFGCVAGCFGCLLAVKKETFVYLNENKLLMEDLLLPLYIQKKGHYVKYEPLAAAYENTEKTFSSDIKRKERIAVSNYIMIPYIIKNLTLKNAFFVLSHKLIRFFIPQAFVLLVILSLLNYNLFISKAVLTAALLTVAASLFSVKVKYFLRLILIYNLALFKAAFKEQKSHWETNER